ncbi:hypothetical protein SGFS_098150 [Streptomyces graminofaciens]|uniref:Beta-glucosidase n=1 Tax=Streptomyces graminofaciens TaxID=68212 RepID=A0ABM7FNW1_9ACTN|nr:family 1 glycosylhydrolase [Streptomyces graminofaciens]BBC38521.1 hypothetical protein SGFS_098150 [Streptomyces graminofaciens]
MNSPHGDGRIVFPGDFVFGTATSAFQIEGAWDEDGKGPSIWDTFGHTPGKVHLDIPGDVAVDHYHRFREDVALMRDLGVDSYRLSLSWSRLLPEGTGAVNRAGIDFYHRLLDEQDAAGISPNVTLYHWDLPQALEDRGGWGNRDVAKWFRDYAALAFEEFGERVPHWVTLNEPIAIWVGYGMGMFAPGRRSPWRKPTDCGRQIGTVDPPDLHLTLASGFSVVGVDAPQITADIASLDQRSPAPAASRCG